MGGRGEARCRDRRRAPLRALRPAGRTAALPPRRPARRHRGDRSRQSGSVAPILRPFHPLRRLPAPALGRRRPIAPGSAALVVEALARAGIDVPVGDLIDAHGDGRRRVTLHATPRGPGLPAGRATTSSSSTPARSWCRPLARCRRKSPPPPAAAWAPADALVTRPPATGLDLSLTTQVRGTSPILPRWPADFDLSRVALNGEVLILQTSLGARNRCRPCSNCRYRLSCSRPTAGEATLAGLVARRWGRRRRSRICSAASAPSRSGWRDTAQVLAVDIDRTCCGRLRQGAAGDARPAADGHRSARPLPRSADGQGPRTLRRSCL